MSYFQMLCLLICSAVVISGGMTIALDKMLCGYGTRRWIRLALVYGVGGTLGGLIGLGIASGW